MYLYEQKYYNICMTVESLNLLIADGKKIRYTMTTMREAGLSRPEAGLDPRLTANGAPKAPKEEEECHVSQKLAVLQEESLKPIKEDLAEWIARTLGNQGGGQCYTVQPQYLSLILLIPYTRMYKAG